MSESPHIWEIGKLIQIELFIGDPNTGAGSTGQVANITFTIRRSNNDYWTGAAWSSTLTTLTMTEVDATNNKGRYIYSLSSAANNQEDKYIAHVIVNDPPTFAAMEAYELHVSRDTIVRVYESEPL